MYTKFRHRAAQAGHDRVFVSYYIEDYLKHSSFSISATHYIPEMLPVAREKKRKMSPAPLDLWTARLPGIGCSGPRFSVTKGRVLCQVGGVVVEKMVLVTGPTLSEFTELFRRTLKIHFLLPGWSEVGAPLQAPGVPSAMHYSWKQLVLYITMRIIGWWAINSATLSHVSFVLFLISFFFFPSSKSRQTEPVTRETLFHVRATRRCSQAGSSKFSVKEPFRGLIISNERYTRA